MAENNIINNNNNQNNDVLMDGLHQPQNQPDDTGLPQHHQQQQQQQQDTDSSFSGAEAAPTATNPSKQQLSASLLEVSSLLEGRLKSRSGSTNNEGEEEDAGLVVAPGTSSQVNKNDTYEIDEDEEEEEEEEEEEDEDEEDDDDDETADEDEDLNYTDDNDTDEPPGEQASADYEGRSPSTGGGRKEPPGSGQPQQRQRSGGRAGGAESSGQLRDDAATVRKAGRCGAPRQSTVEVAAGKEMAKMCPRLVGRKSQCGTAHEDGEEIGRFVKEAAILKALYPTLT